MACALCSHDTTITTRVSGLDLCEPCMVRDPKDALGEHHGIDAAWDTRMGRFNAGLGIPDQDPSFTFTCVPLRWPHRLIGWAWPGLQIGDAEFDSRVRTSSSDPEGARARLEGHGCQSAILAFLTSVVEGEVFGNHVRLRGPTLTVSVRPQGTWDEARVQELQLEAAVLALHLRAGGGSARPG